MKFYRFIMTVILLFVIFISEAQDNIRTYPLEITFNKTSSLIFPAIIKSVDRGSKDVLAQKAKGMGNVLQVKAGRMHFPETSLTIITADGLIHQFTVNYAEEPKRLNISLDSTASRQQGSIMFNNEMTDTEFLNYTKQILNSRKPWRFRKSSKYKVALGLKGIFINNNTLFFHLTGKNTSNINYTIEFLRFYIRDNKRIKRSASQELEIKPFFINQEPEEIKGKSITEWVFAMDKFTIPDAKHLVIEMFENNGGRHLFLLIKNRTLVKARALP